MPPPPPFASPNNSQIEGDKSVLNCPIAIYEKKWLIAWKEHICGLRLAYRSALVVASWENVHVSVSGPIVWRKQAEAACVVAFSKTNTQMLKNVTVGL